MLTITAQSAKELKKIEDAMIKWAEKYFEGIDAYKMIDEETTAKLKEDFALYEELAEEKYSLTIPCSYLDYDNYPKFGHYNLKESITYAFYNKTDINHLFDYLEMIANCKISVYMNNWGKHRYLNTCYSKDFYNPGVMHSMLELTDRENDEVKYLLTDDEKALEGFEIGEGAYPLGTEITNKKTGEFVLIPYYYKAVEGNDDEGYKIEDLSKVSSSPTLEDLKKYGFNISDDASLEDFVIERNKTLAPKADRIFEGKKYVIYVRDKNKSEDEITLLNNTSYGCSNRQNGCYLKNVSYEMKEFTFGNDKACLFTDHDNHSKYIKYVTDGKIKSADFVKSVEFRNLMEAALNAGFSSSYNYLAVSIMGRNLSKIDMSCTEISKVLNIQKDERNLPASCKEYFGGKNPDSDAFEGFDVFGNHFYYEMDCDEIFTVTIDGHKNIPNEDFPLCYDKTENEISRIAIDVNITKNVISDFFDDAAGILEDSFQNIERYSLYSQGNYVYYLVDKNGKHVSSFDEAVGYEKKGWDYWNERWVDEPCPFIFIKEADWDSDNECIKEEARSKYPELDE